MNYTVKSVIPVSSGAVVTATGTSAQFVLPNGGGSVEALVQATAVTGTSPSLTAKLQVSQDGVNWFDVASAAALTAAGTVRIAGQSLAAYGRLSYTVSGTTPSFTLTVTVLAN